MYFSCIFRPQSLAALATRFIFRPFLPYFSSIMRLYICIMRRIFRVFLAYIWRMYAYCVSSNIYGFVRSCV